MLSLAVDPLWAISLVVVVVVLVNELPSMSEIHHFREAGFSTSVDDAKS